MPGPPLLDDRLELPRTTPLVEVRDEDRCAEPQIRTFFFDLDLDLRPGQFVQVWLPGVDEKPFSVSYQDGARTGVTVAKVGPFTERLFQCAVGDMIGVRGPYGNGFDLGDAQRIVIVNGGCGCAPTALLAEQAHRGGRDVTYIIGARTSEWVIFEQRMAGQGIRTLVATDDGSEGHHGFATELLEDALASGAVDAAFSCGPEVMLKRVFTLCRGAGVPCQLSLERYMKCAIGICGACALDSTGWLVCKDGPVFTGEQLAQVTEFGNYHRDAAGRPVPV